MEFKQYLKKFENDIMSFFGTIHNKLNDENRKKLYIGLAILIGIILILPPDVTWAVDRLNYMDYADHSDVTLGRYFKDGIGTVFANEPLFLVINIALSFLFSNGNVLRIIIFVSTLIALYNIGKKTAFNLWVLGFFILIPQFNVNYVIHLRQGLALSVYLLGLNQKDYRIEWVLKVLAALIHTSIVFIILFEILDMVLKKINLKFNLKLFLVALFFLILVNSFSILSLFISDRRFEEYAFSTASNASGLGFLLWFFVGIFFIIMAKRSYTNRISFYGIIFYLTSYYFVEFGARVFENILPLIIIGMLNEENKRIKYLYILFLVCYGLVQWYTSGGMNFYIN